MTLRFQIRSMVLAAAMSLVAALPAAAAIKVAVIGAQHIHSHQLKYPQEVPAKMQTILGAGYDVQNFGDCCATILQGYPHQSETHPYLEGGEKYGAVGGMNFHDSLAFKPDIVVIGPFGKHDTEIANQLYKGMLDPVHFKADFDQLVTTYLNQPQKPKVIVSTPIPIPRGSAGGVVTPVMLPATLAVAMERNVPVMDFYNAFLDKPNLFKDETHITNDQGLQLLADTMAAAVKQAASGAAPGSDASAPPPSADAAVVATPDASAPPPATGGTTGSGGSAPAGSGGSASPPPAQPDAAVAPTETPPAPARPKGGCAVGGDGGAAPVLVLIGLALFLGRRRRR
jgi:MYXO-CTERM domain-containing protein